MPKASVDRAIISWPHLLGCSSSKIKLIVEEIGKLGVKNNKLGTVISKSPQILLRKPQEFVEVGFHFVDTSITISCFCLVDVVLCFFNL